MRAAETSEPRRELLLDLLQVALERVDGRRCVRAALSARPPSPDIRVGVAAVGKAAAAMARGAHDALGSAIEHTLVITREGDAAADLRRRGGTEVLFSGHPLPDARSLAAGERLLDWVDRLDSAVLPLFLVSGGASALVEAPEAGVSLDDCAALTRQSFVSGMAIGELNARRAALSRIKGGKLAARLAGRAARALFLSDVPGDDPRVIGSGLLGPAVSRSDRIERAVVASIDQAVAAVASAAADLGLSVRPAARRFAGDATRLAARFAHELCLSPAQLLVWGGESTVQLPARPGRGGRNQHLALASARLLAGHPELLLLAAGTDGSDGASDDAGALVDAETCARLALAQLDADQCLAAADSGRALEASGDLIHTGATGTNVGDLVIGLKLRLEEARVLSKRHGGLRPRML